MGRKVEGCTGAAVLGYVQQTSRLLQQQLLDNLDAVGTVHTQHIHRFVIVRMCLHLRLAVRPTMIPPPDGAFGYAYVHRLGERELFDDALEGIHAPVIIPIFP